MKSLFVILIAFFAILDFSIACGDGNYCAKKSAHILDFPPSEKELSLRNKWLNKAPSVQSDDLKETYIDALDGKLRVHFDLTTDHAPSLVDLNNNDIPDYIDSVIYYFDIITNEYEQVHGYDLPIPDGGRNGSDAYDIVIENLGPDATYGYVFATSIAPKRNVNESYFSIMYIDNDFSINDSIVLSDGRRVRSYPTLGIDALKITLAHEFQHSIQYFYGISQMQPNSQLMEMTATFMEYYFYPEVEDYLNYANRMLANPQNYTMAEYDDTRMGYSNALFLIMCDSKLKNTQKFVHNIWEYTSLGQNGLEPVENALKDEDLDFTELFCEYSEWLYHTGDRAEEGRFFAKANRMRPLQPQHQRDFPNNVNPVSDFLPPLSIAYYSLLNPSFSIDESGDTLDIIYSNTRYENRFVDMNRNRILINQSIEPLTNGEPFGDNKFYYSIADFDDAFCLNIKEKLGQSAKKFDYVYPNPFRLDTREDAYAPVPNKGIIGTRARLNIYNIEMQQLASLLVPISNEHGLKCVRFNPEEFINQSGVYIIEVRYNEDSTVSKLIVNSK